MNHTSDVPLTDCSENRDVVMTMTWGIRIGQKVHITSRVDYQHFKNPKLLCILCKVSHFKSTKKLFQIRFCKL